MNRRWILIGLLLMAAGLASWLTGLDDGVRDLLRLPLASPLRGAVLHLTRLGSLLVLGPIALLVVILLALRGARRHALWLFLTIASGRLTVELVKLAVMRPRPPQADRLDLVTSWSFPSSHSAGTMLTCLALAMLVPTRAALAAAIGFAILIGWSRLALAVHWPGDVLAGWGFAILWVGLARRYGPPNAR